MSKRSDLLASLLLVPASLLALLLASELFFRFVLPAPELPAPAFIDTVLRHAPGQRGVYWSAPFRLVGEDSREETRAPWRINAQGWNSAHANYPLARTPGRLRVAVVGDSYVEALQVPPDQSLAEDLERELGAGAEVFRYGISGAPLSQYLHMARRVALPARPDVLVVLLVHNDFDESWRYVPGMYTRSFLHLRLDQGAGAEGPVKEIPPEPYRQGLTSRIRNGSATWRYLAYGLQVRFETLRQLLLAHDRPASYQANIDIGDLAAREVLDRRATAYAFGRLAAESAQAGARLLLVMDGVRGLIEAGSPQARDYNAGALRLNRMAGEEAARLGIPFLDLHPLFAEDFRLRHQPFAFKTDGHWNAYAHALAASALAAKLRGLGWTVPGAPGRLQ